MKLLFSLTYYRPHVSGLTIYVQRVAEEFAARGHTATVICSQYIPSLPLEDNLNGVRIVRVPVNFWISKGAIMLNYSSVARQLIAEHDVCQINLPNTFVEGLALPYLSKRAKKPIVATYHCDLNMPPGVVNRLVDEAVFWTNVCAGKLVNRIVAYTQDYASHSRFLRCFPQKIDIIPPPVDVQNVPEDSVRAFKEKHAAKGQRLIGFAARFATEKGVEYLLSAITKIREVIPNVRVLFAGDYKNVIGEEKYRELLMPIVEQLGDAWEFLGVLNPTEMATFFKACDVTVLPSINSTESFGMVQVESMLCGTPVVASDLPGVRVSVQSTGMGKIVPIKDAPALSEAIIEVINNRAQYVKPRESISSKFSIKTTVDKYEQLFESLIRK